MIRPTLLIHKITFRVRLSQNVGSQSTNVTDGRTCRPELDMGPFC